MSIANRIVIMVIAIRIHLGIIRVSWLNKI